MVYKRKLKDWNCTKRRESKISKSVEMWFNTIGLTTNHEDVVITSFPSRYGKAAWPFLIHLLTGRQPYSFPLFHFLFLTPRLAKFILNSLLSLRGRKYSKTISACLAYKFCRLQTQPFPSLRLSQNDLIGSRSNGGHLENSSINNRHTATAFIHAFGPTSTRQNSLSLPSQHNFGVKPLLRNYSKTTSKLVLAKFLSPLRNYSKTTSKLVLAKFLSPLRNYSKTTSKLVLAKFLSPLRNYSKTTSKLVLAKFLSPLRNYSKTTSKLVLAKFLSPLRNYSKTISKLVLAKYSALQNQPSCSPILTK